MVDFLATCQDFAAALRWRSSVAFRKAMGNPVCQLTDRTDALDKLPMRLFQAVECVPIERRRIRRIPRHERSDFVDTRTDECGQDLLAARDKFRTQRRLLLLELAATRLGEADGRRCGTPCRLQG